MRTDRALSASLNSDYADDEPIPRVFSSSLFGVGLARRLDALYAMEKIWHSVDLPNKPRSGLFSHATGDSFREADALTRHFYLTPMELDYHFTKDTVPGARALFDWEEGLDTEWLMLAVREELAKRAQNV